MQRVIRRLSALEYVILAGALLLALLGGALAAWLLRVAAGFPFGVSWAVASLLLFVLPAAAVYGRELRSGSRVGHGPTDEPGRRGG